MSQVQWDLVLAFIGPKALKRDAEKFAEKAVLDSIDEAMKDDGKAIRLIDERFPPHEGPVKDWMEECIERQVISILPLIIDRVGLRSGVGPIDPNEPEDEGTVE